jgi:equilibrative nucleoside transporter 1/2/3
MAYFIFVMLGVGALFPFNAFISVPDYFHDIYPTFPWQFIVGLAYNYPSIAALLLSVKYGPRVSFTTRTLFGLVTSLLALGSVPLVTQGVPFADISLGTMLLVTFITGIAVSTMFGGILGLASIFPPRFITAVMIGNGVAGIIVTLIGILTRFVFPTGAHLTDAENVAARRDSAYLYFALAAGVLLLCIVLFMVLMRLPITQHYHSRHVASQRRAHGVNGDDDGVPSPQGSVTAGAVVNRWNVLKKIKVHAFSVFTVFFVTLSLFPGIVTTVPPADPDSTWGKSWFTTTMIGMFMLFDWAGRQTPSVYVPRDKRFIWMFVLARVVFFPLFILCIKPRVFDADWIPIVTCAVFAWSNGYLGTLAMMFGPSVVDDHERETAGIIMSLMLNSGIFTGVHFALAVLYGVTGQIGLPAAGSMTTVGNMTMMTVGNNVTTNMFTDTHHLI